MASNNKRALIQKIKDRIVKKLSKRQGKLCAEFCEQLLSTVAFSDLKKRESDDLYGLTVSFWRFIYTRQRKETKIRIYNPDYERDGWQSTHTVIEIIADDMPFLVESVRMEINRLSLTTHMAIHMGDMQVSRDKRHQISQLYSRHNVDLTNIIEEAPIYLEIDRQTDQEFLDELTSKLERILHDVRVAVEDWGCMREKVQESIQQLNSVGRYLDATELTETISFLQWIDDHNFTYLGVRDYQLVKQGREHVLQIVLGSGYGVLHEASESKVSRSLSSMTPEARKLMLSPEKLLIISKTSTISTIHRPTYTDCISIKLFDKKGNVIGERRVIGLYGATAYNTDLENIPFIGRKVELIMRKSGFSRKSHAGKSLLNILQTLPRDDLFQAHPDQLVEVAMGIVYLQERRVIKLFAMEDIFGRFISCLVYVPKDRYNTELRQQMQAVLMKAFNAKKVLFSPRFFESILARIHFVVLIDRDNPVKYDLQKIEQQLIKVARIWQDDLAEALLDVYGEEEGNYLICHYAQSFSASYREDFSPRVAVYDIRHFEQITDKNPLEMNFYAPVDSINGNLRFRVYRHDSPLPLSDALPILENMGLRVTSERPYRLNFKDGKRAWINDFNMQYCGKTHLDIEQIRDTFETAFAKIWFGKVKNDALNKLVLSAGLTWREITVFRAYSKYFRQTGFPFSQEYIAATITDNPEIARHIIALFKARFDPQHTRHRIRDMASLEEKISLLLDEVANLDEDRILRHYVDVIRATLRTNYFQEDSDGEPKVYVSFKIDPSNVSGMPLPLPMFEIFVYSPFFEGVHLRGGKVARGGIRWSDRREDYRTEILGLMKAQQVKNSVIVPAGAKGGFVPKCLPDDGSREEIMAEGIRCYKNFIRALLDLTDNLDRQAGNKIIKPKHVVCYDEDDSYLVVAADKGTATFSDIANAIAVEYGFWLGDAFASGGSTGYDHKKMGITARGAWESVKRHFRELDKDIQATDFTVIGIGDMAGDVFGNGMLLSRHIKLVAAFNHLHLFIDPDPDPAVSFKERQRLFKLSRSTWEDYNNKLISKGGGVFKRSAKSIEVTAEIRQLLGIKQTRLTPNELLRSVLAAPVDLFWSGGIGTFIKATHENHIEVGDRTNDAVRIDASELRCKVVGEGANLGLTQKARIEYALAGGLINSDFIDNSGGVDCSDHEVNVKILLNDVVANGDLTQKQRDQLLAAMTNDVAELVLRNNYRQSQAISMASFQSIRNVTLHDRYIKELEQRNKIQRDLESLPTPKELVERKLRGQGLTKPGISVLLCYTKNLIKDALLDSKVPEDPYLCNALLLAFPKKIRESYRVELEQHPLRREIVATQVSNIVVNEATFTFVYRLHEETGASVPEIVRAYTTAREILGIEKLWRKISTLDGTIPAQTQIEMLLRIARLLRRLTHWLLTRYCSTLEITETVAYFAPGVTKLGKVLPEALTGEVARYYQSLMAQYIELKVPKVLASEIVTTLFKFSSLDIVEVADELGLPVKEVACVYFAVTEQLELGWLRLQIVERGVDNQWEALSREALRDDIDYQQRLLVRNILQQTPRNKSAQQRIILWKECHSVRVVRWRDLMTELRASTALSYVMLFASIRNLADLVSVTGRKSDAA